MRINNPKFHQCAICKSGVLLGTKVFIFAKPDTDEPLQVCEMCFQEAVSRKWNHISGK